MTILVVDEDPFELSQDSEILQSKKYDFFTCTSLSAAKAYIRQNPDIDIILIDFDKNIYDLLQFVKSSFADQIRKFIVMVEEERYKKILKKTNDINIDAISKPITIEKLEKVLQSEPPISHYF